MATKVKPTRLQITGTPQAGNVPVYVDQDTFQWGAGGGGGGGDVYGPSSSTDGDIVLFDGATGKLIKDSGVGLSSKLDASALSNNNYGGAWENDSTHTPTKGALYTKIHTMDVEIGNKAADNTVVKLTGNQTINGTKTFGTSPVVPSKTTNATNTGTAIATEAQVYKKQDKLTTQTAYTSKGTSTKVPTITTNTLGQVTGITETSISFPVTSVNGQTGAVSLTIPTISTITVTLTSAGWSSNSQTVSATGVTASNTVIVSPAPDYIQDYADCGVYGYGQGSGTVTFKCDTVPSGDIVVNVLIMS